MNQKHFFFFIALVSIFTSCQNVKNPEDSLSKIIQTEKDFEKLVADSGIAIAFKFYAAEDAVILRKNDSIIKGKDGIMNYYQKYSKDSISLKWDVEFADISGDGTLAYTWGNSIFKILRPNGKTEEFHGKFHAVWKKQADGNWKFVWD